MSWWGAVTAFFWSSLVRVALLHHVTWSVNSFRWPKPERLVRKLKTSNGTAAA